MSIMDAPITLSGVCVEDGRTITRHIRLMSLTAENLKRLWEESRKFKTLFGEELNNDFEKFVSMVVKPSSIFGIDITGLFWVIDDFVGVYYLTDIRLGHSARVHYSFFDRRQNGRYDLTIAMIHYAFETYGFKRLEAELPLFAAPSSFMFIRKLGFKLEGRKRKAAFYNQTWFDVKTYGLLKEEI